MSDFDFPFFLEESAARFREPNEEESIRQSVRFILLTQKGERPFLPDFGTRLNRFAFERIDNTTLSLIRQEVLDALYAWENRITEVEVEFERRDAEGVLIALVSYYTQRGTQSKTEVPLLRG